MCTRAGICTVIQADTSREITSQVHHRGLFQGSLRLRGLPVPAALPGAVLRAVSCPVAVPVQAVLFPDFCAGWSLGMFCAERVVSAGVCMAISVTSCVRSWRPACFGCAGCCGCSDCQDRVDKGMFLPFRH